MSSSLKDLQCIAVCKVDASNAIQNKYHSPAEWAGCRVTDSHPPTNEPCRQTFVAHGRPRLSCSGTVTGPGRRKGTTEGGRETTASGEGSHPTAHQKQQARKPRNTKGGTQRPRRRQPQNRRQKHKQKDTHRGDSKRGTKKKTKNKKRARKAQTKTRKTRDPGGRQDHEKASKRPPQIIRKWEQITKRCQGIVAQGTGQV